MKLASVERILSLTPIPGADKIEVATIKGWKVVVQKNIYNVNDLCVYIEIDSLVPLSHPAFTFLNKDKEGVTHHRVRTIKLKQQISQGLVIPLSYLPSYVNWVEGNDVTEILEVKKYEKEIPVQMRGQVLRYFPSFLRKTDEERGQNLINEFADFQGKGFYITEKLDGTSFTAYLFEGKFGVCSRNLELKETEDNIYWQIARKYNIENLLKEQGQSLAIQGEIVGPGIQDNKYKLNGHQLFVFRVWDIYHNRALSVGGLGVVAAFFNELDSAPLVGWYPQGLELNLDKLIDMSVFKSTLNSDVWAEGIVVRTINHDPYFSFKIINPMFALKYGE